MSHAFPIKDGQKLQRVLTALHFNFDVIRKVQENQEIMELNGTRQF
jgi:hypothetical protein